MGRGCEQHVCAAHGGGKKYGLTALQRPQDVAIVWKDVDQSPAEADDRVMTSLQIELPQAAEILALGVGTSSSHDSWATSSRSGKDLVQATRTIKACRPL